MTSADVWSRVKWTEAAQVFAAMEIDDRAPPPAQASPHAYFAERRAAGELEFAAAFLAQALPRFEAVAWAARFLEEQSGIGRSGLSHSELSRSGIGQSGVGRSGVGRSGLDRSGIGALPPADRQALDHALRWLGEPTEAHRIAAGDAADAAGKRSAERLLATAAFMSGGSIAPPDLPPVHPAPMLCGRLAGAAVAIAAHRSGDRAAAFARALDLGEAVAGGGAEAIGG